MVYNAAQDQCALKSAGEINYVDSIELFLKVSKGEKVLVEGVERSIPGFSIAYQKHDDLFVDHISMVEFKNKVDEIYR